MASPHKHDSMQQSTLSKALREGTARSHRAVERSKGVGLLLHDTDLFDRKDYIRWLVMLTCIYVVLERRLEGETAEVVAPLVRSGLMTTLARTQALLSDLRSHLSTLEEHTGTTLPDLATLDDVCTPTEAESLSPLAPALSQHIRILTSAQLSATRAYAAHLATVDANLLLAHAYTRYLGDLSGGQHILRKIAKKFPTEDAGGFAFYEFDGQPAALKDEFRVAMEKGASKAWVERLVQEANRSFDMNALLFDSLVPVDMKGEELDIPTAAVEMASAIAQPTPAASGKLASLILLSAASAILVAFKLSSATASASVPLPVAA